MGITIEHNAHIVWDVNEIFPGETIADAFLEAGGSIIDRDNGQITVVGLPFECVRKLCNACGADYIGPVLNYKEPPKGLKDVTPKTLALAPA